MVCQRGEIEMKNLDDLRKQYKPLSEVKVPDETRERIYNMIDEYSSGASAARPKRGVTLTWMKSVAAVVACLVVVGGVYSYSNHNTLIPNHGVEIGKNETGSVVGGRTWVVPANVAWNGYYYETKGYIHTVGSRLGVAMYPGPAKLYSIPGQNPDQRIAVEVDTPNGKYVSAIRVPVGTKTTPIPSNWMTINVPKLGSLIQPGEKITVSGNVFFRELYGTTIAVGIKRQGSQYPQLLATQQAQVSDNGTITVTFEIPKELSGQLKKTEYLLVFRETSKQYPTTAYYFPMMLK
jgi:hypothetical protein